jgi:hypothetical protein
LQQYSLLTADCRCNKPFGKLNNIMPRRCYRHPSTERLQAIFQEGETDFKGLASADYKKFSNSFNGLYIGLHEKFKSLPSNRSQDTPNHVRPTPPLLVAPGRRVDRTPRSRSDGAPERAVRVVSAPAVPPYLCIARGP